MCEACAAADAGTTPLSWLSFSRSTENLSWRHASPRHGKFGTCPESWFRCALKIIGFIPGLNVATTSAGSEPENWLLDSFSRLRSSDTKLPMLPDSEL